MPIAERRRPRPEGRAGFLRVDTVHEGDLAALREVNRARAELFRTIGLASDAESAA